MVQAKIRFVTIQDIRDFVNLCARYDFDIDLKSGRYVVDAKSIMGIFSLDLMSDIELTANVDNAAERAAFENDIKRFCV